MRPQQLLAVAASAALLLASSASASLLESVGGCSLTPARDLRVVSAEPTKLAVSGGNHLLLPFLGLVAKRRSARARRLAALGRPCAPCPSRNARAWHHWQLARREGGRPRPAAAAAASPASPSQRRVPPCVPSTFQNNNKQQFAFTSPPGTSPACVDHFIASIYEAGSIRPLCEDVDVAAPPAAAAAPATAQAAAFSFADLEPGHEYRVIVTAVPSTAATMEYARAVTHAAVVAVVTTPRDAAAEAAYAAALAQRHQRPQQPHKQQQDQQQQDQQQNQRRARSRRLPRSSSRSQRRRRR